MADPSVCLSSFLQLYYFSVALYENGSKNYFHTFSVLLYEAKINIKKEENDRKNAQNIVKLNLES